MAMKFIGLFALQLVRLTITIKQEKDEIRKVTNIYKFDTIHNLKLKTMQIDEYSMSELVSKISKIINAVKPNILYLPFKADVHSDHRKIFEAAYSCTKSFRYPFIKKIYMMESFK